LSAPDEELLESLIPFCEPAVESGLIEFASRYCQRRADGVAKRDLELVTVQDGKT
jgi:hypothetical protein